MRRAKWGNGRRTVTGYWVYHWASDTFYVRLDAKSAITGRNEEIVLKGEDSPEWGKWKLVREDPLKAPAKTDRNSCSVPDVQANPARS